MQESNFDRFIRLKLLRIKPRYSEDAWNDIARELDKQDSLRKRRQPMLPLLLIAAFSIFGNIMLQDTHETASRHAFVKPAVSLNPLTARMAVIESKTDKNMMKQQQDGSSAQPAEELLEKPSYKSGSISSLVTTKTNSQIQAPAKDISLAGTEPAKKTGEAVEKVYIAPILAEYARKSAAPKNILKASKPRHDDMAFADWQSTVYHFWDNPAYTGTEALINLNVDNELTLDAADRAVYNNHFALDADLPKTSLGFGFFRQRESRPYSITSKTGLSCSYPLLSSSAGILRIGGTLSYLSRNAFPKELEIGNDVEPVFGYAYNSKGTGRRMKTDAVAFDAGLMFIGKRILAGLSVENINRPQLKVLEEGGREPAKIKATAAYCLRLGKHSTITPFAEASFDHMLEARILMFVQIHNKFMLAGGIEKAQPQLENLTPVIMAGSQLGSRWRVFASYGIEKEIYYEKASNHILKAGLRYQWQ